MDGVISPEALAALARDPDRDVRLAAVGNFETPDEALVGLARDPDSDVRLAAVANDAISPERFFELASDSVTSPEVLAVFALNSDSDVRQADVPP